MSSEENSSASNSNSVNETYGFSPELMDQLARDNEIYNNPNRPKTTFTAGEKQEFSADDIRVKVSAFIRDIEEFVEKWELCGGIRRGNPTAHDADVVVWVKWLHNPETMMSLQHKLADVATKYQQEGSVKFIEEILKAEQKPKRKSSKPAKPKPPRKNYRFMYDGIKFDVWVCLNEQQFEVQKLIRTGSRDFGHLLASRAQEYKETAQRPDGSTYETKGGCIKFGHDPFFDQDFYGFYGAAFGWVRNEETGKSKQGMIVNPARLLAWRENDIILKVFGDVEGLQYLDPANRNIEFTAGATTTATGVSEGNFDGGESSYE